MTKGTRLGAPPAYGLLRPRITVLALLFTVFIVPTAGLAAKRPKAPDFPAIEFFERERLARWLLDYDWLAWHSSDLVMAESEETLDRLGSEWFCLKADGAWHAVYGRYDRERDTYDAVLHYVYKEGHGIVRTEDPLDPATLNRYGRVVRLALDRVPDGIRELGLRFNYYVRPAEGRRLEVWILPGGQPDGRLVYGGDVRYVFDTEGREILETHIDFERFEVARPDRGTEIDIDRRTREVAGVGDIFFILQFRTQFKAVRVWTRCFMTQMLEVEENKPAWVHAERTEPGCGTRTKSRRR